MDFYKTFNFINHSILIDKLKAFNINKTMLDKIVPCISNRTDRVSSDHYLSENFTVNSGVPQGNH